MPMLFASLDRASGASETRARLREFADGQIIQQRGQVADGFWLIEEGAVMVGQFGRDGDFRAVALLGRAIPMASWQSSRRGRGSSMRCRAGKVACG